MKLFLILLAVVFIISVILFTKLNFCFDACYDKNSHKYFTLKVYVFSRKLGFNISMKNDKKANKKKKSSNEQEISATDDEEKGFLTKIKNIKNNIEIFKNTFSSSSKSIKKTITVKNINLKAQFGLGDAALTGIATGALWGVLYSAFAVICKIFTVQNHDFKIDPIFNKKITKINFDGILYTRLFDIIIAAVVIYKNYVKAKNIIYEKQ